MKAQILNQLHAFLLRDISLADFREFLDGVLISNWDDWDARTLAGRLLKICTEFSAGQINEAWFLTGLLCIRIEAEKKA